MRIAGVAAAVPRNVVYTTDFDFFTLEEAEVFNNTVGIKQRHIAPEDVCASDLCFAAAEQLLADLKWERESVDVLIFESVTGDYKTPPTHVCCKIDWDFRRIVFLWIFRWDVAVVCMQLRPEEIYCLLVTQSGRYYLSGIRLCGWDL